MTDFKAGQRYLYTHNAGTDARSGQIVTVVKDQHLFMHGYIRAKFDDGVIGSFFPEELSEEKVEAPWRYNDHIVVYPETRDQGHPYNNTLGRGVTILNETPLPKIYTRWENRPEVENDEITAAARAYFEAHPLPKPAWHDPHTNEAWELTVNGDTGPFVVLYNPWEIADREYRFQAGNGTLVDYISDEITAGRRIYPEPSE